MAKHITENKAVGIGDAETREEHLVDFEFPLEHQTVRAKNLEEARRELERRKQNQRPQETINNQN